MENTRKNVLLTRSMIRNKNETKIKPQAFNTNAIFVIQGEN